MLTALRLALLLCHIVVAGQHCKSCSTCHHQQSMHASCCRQRRRLHIICMAHLLQPVGHKTCGHGVSADSSLHDIAVLENCCASVSNFPGSWAVMQRMPSSASYACEMLQPQTTPSHHLHSQPPAATWSFENKTLFGLTAVCIRELFSSSRS